MSQREKIRQLFLKSPYKWIPLPEITGLGIAMYPPRIKELRDKGMCIINKTEIVHGEKHSWYKYIPIQSYKPEPTGQLSFVQGETQNIF